jgi:hypothetical protein
MNDLSPIRKSVTVPLTPREAFALFTERMGTWWPLEGRHTVYGAETDGVLFEGRVGGRVAEKSKSGELSAWAEVTVWRPPERFEMAWHPSRGPETAQRVEVTFTAVSGGTRVDLVHSGWEALGPDAGKLHAAYTNGWDFVFGERFARAAA